MKVALLAAGATIAALSATLGSASTAAEADPPALSFPVACEPGRTCEIQHYVDRDPGPGTRDYRCGLETYQGHNGIDIRLPDLVAQRRGVAVLAAAPGTVTRLRDGVADVSVAAAGPASVANQECGNGVVVDHGGGWETQYCHLARGSLTVKPGQTVTAGTPLGRIGLSGLTQFPHLHLTVRHAGQVVDPFAPDPAAATSCQPQRPLWTAQATARMPYRAGVVLNAGFSARQVSQDDVENGAAPPATAASPLLVAYVRAIGLLPGDEIELELKAPDGTVLAKGRRPPLTAWRAQDLYLVGKKRPASGWAKGVYVANYRVWRQGKAAISRHMAITLDR